MLVWLASYPRSGNTFLRIVLHRAFGLRSSVIYSVDGVAERLGADTIGYEHREQTLDELRRSPDVHLVKTHRQLDADVAVDDAAVCLVRDGRDALVSWARQRVELAGGRFEDRVTELIDQDQDRGTGSWGRNVLSWVDPSHDRRAVLRYEDLVTDPLGAVTTTLARTGLNRSPVDTTAVPDFDTLHGVDAGFFRRGRPGSHVDELPEDLEQRFWSRPDNVQAMALLGYGVAG